MTVGDYESMTRWNETGNWDRNVIRMEEGPAGKWPSFLLNAWEHRCKGKEIGRYAYISTYTEI